jgi:hypothetical protein
MRAKLILAVSAVAMGCGGGGYSNPNPGNPNPSPNPVPEVMITIAGGSLSPQTVHVQRGATVSFVNNDSNDHEISSNPHPTHTECPELNVGRLGPGQKAVARMDSTRASCGFHDHLDETNASLQGTIFLDAATGGGDGTGGPTYP